MSDDSEAWRGEPEPIKFPSIWSSMMFGTPMTPEQQKAYEEVVAKKAATEKAEAEAKAMFIAPLQLDRCCAKCGHESAKIKFCAGSSAGTVWSGGSSECYRHTAGREHFHRTCKLCKYVWYEWPRDAEANPL